jgi:hypothetical protein
MRLYLLGRGLEHWRSPGMRNGVNEWGEFSPGSLVAGWFEGRTRAEEIEF